MASDEVEEGSLLLLEGLSALTLSGLEQLSEVPQVVDFLREQRVAVTVKVVLAVTVLTASQLLAGDRFHRLPHLPPHQQLEEV